MPFLAIYSFFIASGIVCAFSRRRVLLVRGISFLILTSAMVAGVILSFLSRDEDLPRWLTLICLITMPVALYLRRRWVLLWYDPVIVAADVENALHMLLVPYSKTKAGYVFRLRDVDASVRIMATPARIAVVSFRPLPCPKKLELLRSLLRKKIEPLFPRPKFHLR